MTTYAAHPNYTGSRNPAYSDGGRAFGRARMLYDKKIKRLKSCLEKYGSGDKRRSNIELLLSVAQQERVALVENFTKNNMGLVGFVVRRFAEANDYSDIDELSSEGNAALARCVEGYNPDDMSGAGFSAYAYIGIWRALISCASRKRRHLAFSLNAPLGEKRTLNDLLACSSHSMDYCIAEERKKLVHEAIESLTPREMLVVGARFGINCFRGERTLESIGDELGMGKEGARQMLNRILARLSRHPSMRKAVYAVTS